MAFRSGSPADERLILPLFSSYIEPGEIANLPAYNFYTRISSVEAQEPMSGVTVLLDRKASDIVAKQVIESSRAKYGRVVEVKAKPEPKTTKTESKPKTKVTKQQTLEEVA